MSSLGPFNQQQQYGMPQMGMQPQSMQPIGVPQQGMPQYGMPQMPYGQPMGPPKPKSKAWMYVVGVVVVLVVLYVVLSGGDETPAAAGTTPAPGTPGAPTTKLPDGTTGTTPPAAGATGGVTPGNGPAATAPPPAPGTPISTATSPPFVANGVKTIVISKDVTGQTTPTPQSGSSDWKTLSVSEVQAFPVETPTKALTTPDYSSVTINTTPLEPPPSTRGYSRQFPPGRAVDGNTRTYMHTDGPGNIHTLTLVLAQPRNLARVVVYNRSDCCYARLNGAVVSLLDSNNRLVVPRFVLNAGEIQTVPIVPL